MWSLRTRGAARSSAPTRHNPTRALSERGTNHTMVDAIRSLFSPKPAAAKSSPAPDVDAVHLAACSLLLEVAYADGEFSPDERAHLEQVLERHFALPAESGQRLIELAEKERRGSID